MKKTKQVSTREKSAVLTPKQAAFVDARATGMTTKDAMAAAGMQPSDGTGHALERNPKISQALLQERARNAHMLGLTRESVLQGFMDAVDQAKLLADPMSQVAAWREIAKVCGFYAPEVKKLELGIGAKRVLDKMAALSDEELLRIAESDVIDGEFSEVRH